MGLMQLLAVSRSLGKISDEPNRYKMTPQSLLPKFGMAGKVERANAGSRTGAEASGEPRRSAETGFDGHNPQSRGEKMQTMKTIEAEVSEAQVASQSLANQAFPLGRWTLFKNPFSRAPKLASPESPQAGQLMLDLVKPVRNDLSDSDLEMVPAGGSEPATTTQVLGPVSTASVKSSELVWTQIKAQFFGAGKV